MPVYILIAAFLLMACSDSFSPEPDAFNPGSVRITEMMTEAQVLIEQPGTSQTPGWVEITNVSNQAILLNGWQLDFSGSQVPYDFPNGITLAPGDIRLIWMSSEQGDGVLSAGFPIPAQSGSLTLTDGQNTQIDAFSWESFHAHPEISYGRISFAGSSVLYDMPFTQPSPGQKNRLHSLEATEVHSLGVGDPSGVTLDAAGSSQLWVVGDNPGDSVFKITRSGELLKVLSRYQGEDVESIVQHPVNFSLWISEERQRALVNIDTLGFTLGRIELDIPGDDPNNGIEGITINPNNLHFYAVNKRNPRLFIELNSQGDVIRMDEKNFGASGSAGGLSFAGLSYDPQDDVIWMVSDEARAVFILSTEGDVLAAWDAPFFDIEGIAVDREAGMLFLVSDSDAILYHLTIPDEILHLGN